MDAPYTRQVSIKCVGCSKPIKPLELSSTPADQDCWDGGFVHTVVAGYGSENDTSQFLIGICDSCAVLFKEDGRLIEFWN